MSTAAWRIKMRLKGQGWSDKQIKALLKGNKATCFGCKSVFTNYTAAAEHNCPKEREE